MGRRASVVWRAVAVGAWLIGLIGLIGSIHACILATGVILLALSMWLLVDPALREQMAGAYRRQPAPAMGVVAAAVGFIGAGWVTIGVLGLT